MLFHLSNLNSNLALTLGYLNPALNNSAQVVITHASHLCQVRVLSACGPSTTRNLITCVLTICHVKLTQSTALDLRSP